MKCDRAKAGSNQSESVLIMQLPNGLALEFERSDAARRIRLILSQLLFVVSEVRPFSGFKSSLANCSDSKSLLCFNCKNCNSL